MATVKIDAIPTVTAATGDKYVIFDASTGDVGAVNIIVDMQGASTSAAGVSGTVPAPAAGGPNRVLRANATWTETASPSSSGSAQIMEYGTVRNSSGAWNTSSLTLGGMTFVWSQAVSGGGSLNFTRASGFTQAQVTGGQTARKYVDSVYSGSTQNNLDMFSTTTQTAASTITMGGAYQVIEYDFFLRSVTGASNGHWSIKAISDGASGLVITGTYIGPRIS